MIFSPHPPTRPPTRPPTPFYRVSGLSSYVPMEGRDTAISFPSLAIRRLIFHTGILAYYIIYHHAVYLSVDTALGLRVVVYVHVVYPLLKLDPYLCSFLLPDMCLCLSPILFIFSFHPSISRNSEFHGSIAGAHLHPSRGSRTSSVMGSMGRRRSQRVSSMIQTRFKGRRRLPSKPPPVNRKGNAKAAVKSQPKYKPSMASHSEFGGAESRGGVEMDDLSSPVTRSGTVASDMYIDDDRITNEDGERLPADYQPLPTAVLYGYGLPQFSVLSLTLVVAIYIMIYYEKMGANLSHLSFFTALARSFDSMTDPAMGWISDNTTSKHGRRRPYIFIGMWGYVVMFCLLMSPPISEDGGSSTSLWFGAFYILFYLFDTLANVPYYSLGPELTPSSSERTKVFFNAKIYQGIGTLLGAAAPEMVKSMLGVQDDDEYVDLEGLRTSYLVIGVVFSVIYICCMLFVLYHVKERPNESRQVIPLVPSVLRTINNQAFQPLVYGWTMDAIALAALSTMFSFYIEYVIKPDPEIMTSGAVLSMCFGALFSASLMAMPVWRYTASRIGKYRTWCLFNLVNSVTNFTYIFIGEGAYKTVIFLTFLNGFPLGGNFLTDSILADVIDYDEFLNGSRNEGGFSVFASFIPKFVSIPAGAIPIAILAMMGFQSTIDGIPQEQSTAVENFIRLTFAVLPSTVTLISFFIKSRYPLKTAEQVNMVAEGIQEHKKGNSARDPVTGRVCALLELENEDEQKMAYVFDHFSKQSLNVLLDPENISSGEGPQILIKQTKIEFYAVFAIFLFFFTVVCSFFSELHDPIVSIIPILCVIFCGVALCGLVVSNQRYKSAVTISSWPRIPIELIQKIVAHKDKGQRGGEAALPSERLVSYAMRIIDLTMEVEQVETLLEETLDEKDERMREIASLNERITTLEEENKRLKAKIIDNMINGDGDE